MNELFDYYYLIHYLGVNEIQQLSFNYDTGFFKLSFRGNKTLPIYCNETIEIFQYKLQQLYTINSVALTRANNITDSICDITTDSIIYIEFLTEPGDLPLLIIDTNYMTTTVTTSDVPVNITQYQQG